MVASLRRLRAFTLVELLVVMTTIALLLSIAVPRYFHSLDRSKEVALQQSLNIMRESIDKFYADQGRYPDRIDELAEKKYLRAVPVDPITDSTESWVIVAPPEGVKGAVYDIKSGAEGNTIEGKPYADL